MWDLKTETIPYRLHYADSSGAQAPCLPSLTILSSQSLWLSCWFIDSWKWCWKVGSRSTGWDTIQKRQLSSTLLSITWLLWSWCCLKLTGICLISLFGHSLISEQGFSATLFSVLSTSVKHCSVHLPISSNWWDCSATAKWSVPL